MNSLGNHDQTHANEQTLAEFSMDFNFDYDYLISKPEFNSVWPGHGYGYM